MKKGYLILQDGQVFEGVRFGAETDTVGELVFTTGMCGYVETLTDPSYAGQIVMQTYPLIGNYGIIREDFEGACCVKGYVVREYCDTPSNFRTDCDLDTYLKEQGVPGLCGVDTRELTRIIREHGVMNAAICDEIPADLTPVASYAITGVVEAVSCKEPDRYPAEGEERFHYGVDLAANEGTEILCFADGTVTVVGESSSYGKYCMVEHAGGYSTLYAHCSRITVSSGAAVKEGQKIAEVGETGVATGPHLHFELQKNGTYLNPIYYVD